MEELRIMQCRTVWREFEKEEEKVMAGKSCKYGGKKCERGRGESKGTQAPFYRVI